MFFVKIIMKTRKKLIIWMLPLVMAGSMQAQVLTLEECRQMALQHNKKMEIEAEHVAAAGEMEKASIAAFFPKLSANGTYMWNEKNITLLPDRYEGSMGAIDIYGGFEPAGTALSGLSPEVARSISLLVSEPYAALREALTLNIHHVFAGQVGVVQPIFLGGKLIQMRKMARSAKTMAEMKAEGTSDEIVLKVDEAYWRVVSVEKKKALAQQYYDLLVKLSGDVEALYEEGLATQADRLKVMMTLSDAEQSLGKATDGLELSKMALSQLCGLGLNAYIEIDSTDLRTFMITQDSLSMEEILAQRGEIKLLQEAEKMAKSTRLLAASGLMPNIVASANYLISNPNVQNGFSNSFKGQFNAGVVVNVPLVHADDIYRVKAARREERAVQLQIEEARELIQLQVTQARQKVEDAQRKLARQMVTSRHAEEILRLAQESWKEGVLSSTDLMGAQTAWMKAESERIDAAIDLKMCEMELRKVTGKVL